MHDIRFCDECREEIAEGIFERVPHGWDRYRADGRVDRHDPVFRWVHRRIPSFLECTIDDAYRPTFEIEGSTGQGVPARSPRYSFPTRGSVRTGIFVCSQYDVRRDDSLGDHYLISIIVGRDELKKHASNTRLALEDAVRGARDILGVDEEFRPGLNELLGMVAENEEALHDHYAAVLERADEYEPGVDVEEVHRRGRRGERFILERERAWLREQGRPDLAQKVEKLPAKGPNHDIRTFRFADGEAKDHYVHFDEHFIEVKTTGGPRFRGTMSRLQTEFALSHPHATSLAILTGEEEGRELVEPRILTPLEARRDYLHPDIVREWRGRGELEL